MKLLILHRYSLNEALGTNPSLLPMLNKLSQKFSKVIYTSYKGNPQTFEKVIFDDIGLSLNRGSSLDKLIKSILWLFLCPIKSAFLTRKHKIRYIYCDDSLPYYPFLVKLLSPKGTKVIMRLGDLQTGYLFADQEGIYKIAFKLFHSIEVMTWKSIDGIIPISNAMKNYLISEGVNRDMHVVKESIDLTQFYKKSVEGVLSHYGVENHNVVVMFHGAIEKAKGVDVLIDAANLLEKMDNNIKIVIVGDGTEYHRIQNKVEDMNLSNVVLTGWVPLERMNDYINSCDFGIALRSNNMGNDFVVTTALMQYMACEKPLIAPNLCAVNEEIGDTSNAIFYNPGDCKSIAESIDMMVQRRNDWRQMGIMGRSRLQKSFDHNMVASNMSKALGELYFNHNS